MPSPTPDRRARLAGLVLFVGTLLLYAGVRQHEFLAYDDGTYVVHNGAVADGLSARSVRWAFTSVTYACNWHPLTWMSHMLDTELFGHEAAGAHHLTNVVLHALNAVLLLAALLALTRSYWPSVIVAALFACHPLRVESVAWVAERKDVLAGTFWMLTLWAYARWARAPTRGRYALILVVFALGLLAKPMLVTLPCVLLLLDAWPLGRLGTTSFRRLVVEKAPLFLLAGASCAMTLWAQASGGCTDNAVIDPGAWERVVNAVVAYGSYLGKSVWPASLAVFYPHPAVLDPDVSRLLPALASLAVLGLVTLAVMLRRRVDPAPLVGWLWFLGTLVPVIGLLQVGRQAMADRYAYIPLIGLQIAVVFGIACLVVGRREWQRRAGVAAAVVLLLCIVRTARQIPVWHDTLTLFDHALVVTERNHVAHLNLGRVKGEAGRLDEAQAHFEEAVRLVPDFAEAHVNLGWSHHLAGDEERALAELELAVRLEPGRPAGHHRLALVLLAADERERAVEALRAAAALGHRGAARELERLERE